MSTNKRNQGIDILKMFAMLMVVMLHIMHRGGVTAACALDSHSLKYGIEQLLDTFCMSAVNCFVLATGYIMSRHEFKYSRIFKLWGEVVFYSICMTAIAAFFCPWVQITWRDWIKAVSPIATNQYWFVTMYVALFFTMPFLNQILKTLDKKNLSHLLITGFLLLSFYPAVTGRDLFATHGGFSYLWFMYLYLVAGAIALNADNIKTKVYVLTGGGIILPIISLVLQVGSARLSKMMGASVGHWVGYSSPTVFALAVVLLVLFSKIKVDNESIARIISFVAPSVFGVYVLHDNPLFRRLVCWEGRFASLAELSALKMVVGIVGYASLIFVSSVLIDIMRRMAIGRFRINKS